MIKNIFFDFDGVIAESVSAKTEAFREMYLPYGEDIADKVVDYHVRHGGVSRFEKFKYYHQNFLNESISESKVDELAKRFSRLVLDKVIHSEAVLGVGAFIEKYASRLKFWIITGTPTDEIEIIAKRRNIDQYFIGIHGSPKNKKYWTEHLLEKHDLKREETLFLGDATTDQEAAAYSKLHFALRENDENRKIFANYEGQRFTDFYQLEKIFKTDFI